MTLDQKLQLKLEQKVALVNCPFTLAIPQLITDEIMADAVIVFATNSQELIDHIEPLTANAKRGAIVWLCYPKAKQLNTDLNRDSIHHMMPSYHLDTVRQISIDEVWSALRLKYIG